MKTISKNTVKHNTGMAFEVKKDRYIQVFGTSIVDFIAFNLNNLNERFDQARTKADQGKIFISTGDYLISKFNNDMFQIVEDTYEEGTHDLQYGMCSRERWERAFEDGIAEGTYLKTGTSNLDDFPDHGCYENLIAATKPWDIPPEDLPSPLNLFQTMKIDGITGKMEHTKIRPKPGTYVLMKACMDCLVGISACPDLLVGGKDVTVAILEDEKE